MRTAAPTPIGWTDPAAAAKSTEQHATRPRVVRAVGGRLMFPQYDTEYRVEWPDGRLAGIHHRQDLANGDKKMWWSGHNGVGASEMPLYGWHVAGWAVRGSQVIVTEGEKACEALWERGVAAVATVTGAGGTPYGDSLRPLLAYDVVLWADNDDVGRAHMERIAARLSAVGAAALPIVPWGAAPAHGDAYDSFAADGTAEGVEESVSVWTPTAQPNAPKHATSYSYAWNDAGNAQRLLEAGGRERLLYVPKRQFPWHLWDGNCCLQDRQQQVEKWMDETLHAAYDATWRNDLGRAAQNEEAKWLLRSGDAAKIAAALTSASRHVSVLPEVFDTHTWLLPCSNDLSYDLETGGVVRSLAEHRMTRCAPVPALTRPEPHPKWDAVVARVMCGEAEMVRYLRQLMGLFLTGYVGEKSFWFWRGPTNAGKTTVLTFLARLLGEYVYSIPLRALLKQRQDTGILHDIAGTRGMRLVYAEEFKPGDVLDSAWVKKFSGGGDITADRKGELDETFKSTAKLVIGTNDLPTLADVDSALRGRMRVVPFRANIPAELAKAGKPVQSVEEVVADLLTEAPAILYDLVQAVAEWHAAGRQLGMPKPVADASKRYLDNQDVLAEWMDACCEKTADGALTGKREELQLAVWYMSFLKQSGRTDTAAFYQQFGAMLTSKGFDKRSAYAGKRHTGPALTAEARHLAEDAVFDAREGALKVGKQWH